VKFVSKEEQNSNIVATILNGTQQPGLIFGMSLGPRHFLQMASVEPLNYHSSSKITVQYLKIKTLHGCLITLEIKDNSVINLL